MTGGDIVKDGNGQGRVINEADLIKRGEARYVEQCSNCGDICIVYTQRDNRPEYYTVVYVLCKCGSYVEFELPVN